MRHGYWLALAVGLIFIAGAAGTTPALATDAADQPPVPAAGLDQSVAVGTTVYLDAGGSFDPDGTIQRFEWALTAPNGSAVPPPCRNCSKPTFTPGVTGRWTVTLTVTDDTGATATDTLFVTVTDPRGPTVRLRVPDEPERDASTPIVVEATAANASLRRVDLFQDGERIQRHDLAGDSDIVSTDHTFDSTGPTELLAAVTDEAGYVNTTKSTVEVVDDDDRWNPTTCDPGETTVWHDDDTDLMCSDQDIVYHSQDGDQYVLTGPDTNQKGIQLYSDEKGRVVTMATPSQVEQLKDQNGNTPIRLTEAKKMFQVNNQKEMYEENENSITDHSIEGPDGSNGGSGTAQIKPEKGIYRGGHGSVSQHGDGTCCFTDGGGSSPNYQTDRRSYGSNNNDDRGQRGDSSNDSMDDKPPERAKLPSSGRNYYY